MQFLFSVSLLLHIISLTTMAGATLVDAVITQKFWVAFRQNPERGIIIKNAVQGLPLLVGAGMALLILSGVGMMAATGGIFDSQIWFRIKMALVVLVLINTLAFGRRVGSRLTSLLRIQDHNRAELETVRQRLRVFHTIQLSLFFIIFLLSAFKFN